MAEVVLARWKQDVAIAALTSMRIGGPATYFSRPADLEELREDLQRAQELGLTWKILGGGSNTVFADAGYRGLLIQPAFTQIRLLEGEEEAKMLDCWEQRKEGLGTPRYRRSNRSESLHLEEKELGEEGELTFVEMGAGVAWGQAVMASLNLGLTGLHWYARIPCQVGGAIYNNIHGEKHLISEVVVGVYALDPETGEELWYHANDLEFDYDSSLFHRKKGIVTRVVFGLLHVSPAAVAEAKDLYLGWTKAKMAVQPAGANCGSVFQNLSGENLPSDAPLAAAWYIEEVGMKGVVRGTVRGYERHSNFIVHDGSGTQADFIALIQEIREKVHAAFGIWLHPEVEVVQEDGSGVTW